MNKTYIPAIIQCIISLAFVGSLFYLTGWKSVKERRLENYVTLQALEGNKYALRLLKSYKNLKYENKEVVIMALKGNKNALKILNIEEE